MAPLLPQPPSIHDVIVRRSPHPLEPMDLLAPLMRDLYRTVSDSETRVVPKPKRRALLVGICYNQCGGSLSQLKGPHKDVMHMKELLIEHYGYLEKDIVVMMDASHVADEMQPTKVNIKRQMRALVTDAQPGDRFTFVFAGHSDQKTAKSQDNIYPEEDGMDEIIVTSDDKTIRDNKVHKLLVQPLPAGASLFALIDSCHSGTMLDLPHYNCNATYVPWISRGKRRTLAQHMKQVRAMALTGAPADMPTFTSAVESQDTAVIGPPLLPSPRATYKLRLNTTLPLDARPPLSTIQAKQTYMDIGAVLTQSPVCESPDSTFVCTGWCKYDEGWRSKHAHVVSLSACLDMQQAWEDRQGKSLVHLFCEYINTHLERGDQPRYQDLMSHLNHALYLKSVAVHKWTMDKKQRARSQGKTFDWGDAVNFQTPELSSLAKLDLTQPFFM